MEASPVFDAEAVDAAMMRLECPDRRHTLIDEVEEEKGEGEGGGWRVPSSR